MPFLTLLIRGPFRGPVIFFLASAFAYPALCQAGLVRGKADLVCIVRAEEVTQYPLGVPLEAFDQVKKTTCSVTTVLESSVGSIPNRIVFEERIRAFGPPPAPHRMLRPVHGHCYLIAFRRTGNTYVPIDGGYEVTTRTFQLPEKAPLREKINVVLIATLHDYRDNPRVLERIFGILHDEGPSPDSPYYDLLSEYRSFENNPNDMVRARALYGRFVSGETAVMPQLISLTATQGWLAAALPKLFEKMGDDGLTTLCLIAEGKFLPRSAGDALLALRNMANPATLPIMVKCLDRPDGGVRYMAYTAIEATTRKDRRITSTGEFMGQPFDGRIRELKFDPPTSHSVMLVNRMKQWWENEGKKQFDYVLPKEK